MFWKIFYALAGAYGMYYSIMYFAGKLPADNITLGMYCLGLSCVALGEALRR